MSADLHADGRTIRGIESGHPRCQNPAETHGFSPFTPAQNGASESARSQEAESRPKSAWGLGDALGISEVAELLGCSAWTVRHKYLWQGLPHVRASAHGKIVFFRGQVIAWILKRQQQKGGRP